MECFRQINILSINLCSWDNINRILENCLLIKCKNRCCTGRSLFWTQWQNIRCVENKIEYFGLYFFQYQVYREPASLITWPTPPLHWSMVEASYSGNMWFFIFFLIVTYNKKWKKKKTENFPALSFFFFFNWFTMCFCDCVDFHILWHGPHPDVMMHLKLLHEDDWSHWFHDRCSKADQEIGAASTVKQMLHPSAKAQGGLSLISIFIP